MRSYQVFAAMTQERAIEFLRVLQEKSPAAFASLVHAASAALRARPVYLQRQPFEKRAAAVRQALSRVGANALAEEMLALYFLECRKELLLEWLDTAGIAHEDGVLKEASPAEPPAQKLHDAVTTFRKGENAEERELLLQAFAAQSVVDWPSLERLVAPAPASGRSA
jgi:hypothetical protein